MKITRVRTSLLSIGVALGVSIASAPAQAQATSTKTTAAAATDPSMELQRQLDALNAMTDAMGPMVHDIKIRITQMTKFVSEQGLESDWQAYSPTDESASFKGLTFDQALATAIDHQKLGGNPTPTMGFDDLKCDVNATQHLVSAQWGHLNDFHKQVDRLSGFLTSVDKLDAYKSWAITYAQSQLEEAAEVRDERAAAKAEHTAELRAKFDQAEYAWHQEYKMKIRDQNDSIGNDNDDGYYNGSYWNGYADPYYDVWGHGRIGAAAVRTGARAGARAGVRTAVRRDNWHRGVGARPHVSPSVGHPANHMRRRR